jgi:hypothetical protein
LIDVQIGDDLRIRITEGEFTLRQSSEKSFQLCKRYYGWERIENLAPVAIQWNLIFGTATHLFLQERGRGVDIPKALAAAEKSLSDAVKGKLVGDDVGLYEEHLFMLRNIAPVYDAYWGADDAHAFIPLGQEIKGRIPVGDPRHKVFLVFKTDKIVNYLGQLWLIDHKTMRKNDDREFAKYEMDIQPTAYIYGVSKVLGIRVAGIIIDGIIKTKVPQFRRESFLRSDAELKEFEEEFVEMCQEIGWRMKRVQNGENWKTVFYKNTGSCFHWGKACAMLKLCSRDTPVMRMYYEKREPDYMDNPSLLNQEEPK